LNYFWHNFSFISVIRYILEIFNSFGKKPKHKTFFNHVIFVVSAFTITVRVDIRRVNEIESVHYITWVVVRGSWQ